MLNVPVKCGAVGTGHSAGSEDHYLIQVTDGWDHDQARAIMTRQQVERLMVDLQELLDTRCKFWSTKDGD